MTLAVIAAILGMIPAIGLGPMKFLNAGEPQASAEITGTVALVLLYASPYSFTLMVSRVREPSVRGGILIALGLLSLIASLSILVSGITIVFLPATILIWIAAIRSLRASERTVTAMAVPAVVGLIVSSLVVLGFFMMTTIEEPEARCWELVDGHWKSQAIDGETYRVDRAGDRISIGMSGSSGSRSTCISDVITNAEASMTIGVLVVAFLVMWRGKVWAERRKRLRRVVCE